MRFIPTRVGNTPRGAHRPAGRPVHPHACGEYVSVEPSVIVWFGSSPRVWGIRLRRDHRGALARFIPTRVGNTVPSPGRRPGRSVHPHACGEYAVQHVAGSGPDGSSPRVWGIRSYRVRLARRWRFIPTRVGNTIQGTGSGSVISVHPHACGEYIFTRSMPMESVGSSPRVWGILFRKMQEITDCWQSSSVLPSHACCKPAPMTIKRGRSFVKRLLPLVKHCPAGQSRSLDVTCPDRRNARLRS